MYLVELFDPEPQKVLCVVAEMLAKQEKSRAGLHVSMFVNYYNAEHSSPFAVFFDGYLAQQVKQSYVMRREFDCLYFCNQV
ncbi:hypothetical protein QNJ95_44185 [Bradyrhizobium elkanii]|uniref:hypothetical protein n=1 Tax=Bradyrhizobium elkanii TaxID=29448 RepID=UPI0027120C02|nr:hypothetical protein [Bradyrhizobium elkanii]WLA39755.1 hypothetical protein QNJ95_44185 [Bradyrhizobium elkanii]